MTAATSTGSIGSASDCNEARAARYTSPYVLSRAALMSTKDRIWPTFISTPFERDSTSA